MSVLELPVSHGTTTQGNYEASAFFIRLSQDPTQSAQIASEEDEAEILFFGDIESSHTGPVAERLNKEVWKVAAEKWAKGTLRAIFVS
jgi:cAMP phosphodiesterase